jgi:hypothetical protein
MQGAGACAQSGGKSALMDQLTAVLRKNRELQSRLNRKDFEMQEMQNEHEFQQALLQIQSQVGPCRDALSDSHSYITAPLLFALFPLNSRAATPDLSRSTRAKRHRHRAARKQKNTSRPLREN